VETKQFVKDCHEIFILLYQTTLKDSSLSSSSWTCCELCSDFYKSPYFCIVF